MGYTAKAFLSWPTMSPINAIEEVEDQTKAPPPIPSLINKFRIA